MRRLSRAVLLTGLAATVLAGCSRSNTPPTPPTTAAAAPTTRATGAGGVGAAPTSAATPPRCRAGDLAIVARDGGAAAGHRAVILIFTNTGTGTCRLYGYPGADGLDAAGKSVVHAKRTTSGYIGGLAAGAAIPTVDVASGQAASAMLEASGSQQDGSACTPYASLLVTPPDEKQSSRLAWPGDGCADLQIHPIVAGVTGSQS
jgi:hypothetical protein